MRAVFIHDHVFVRDDDVVYTTGTLSFVTFQRYLRHFSTLSVVARQRHGKSTEDFSYPVASGQGVSFSLLGDYRAPADLLRASVRGAVFAPLEAEIKAAEVVIARLPSILGLIGISICRKLRKPYVIELVGCVRGTLWFSQSLLGKLTAYPLYWLTRRAVRQSRYVFYVTEQALQKDYPTNGMSTNVSNVEIRMSSEGVLAQRIQRLEQADYQHNGIILGMIGNVSLTFKGYDIALEALARVSAHSPAKPRLMIAGGGDPAMITSIARRFGIEDQVVCLGRLNGEEKVFDFLDSVDIYLHPSKQEGLPRSVIEAMSRACPVLASDAGGIPELIHTSDLHHVGDGMRLSEQIMEILSEPGRLRYMAERNFSKAKEYDIRVLSERRRVFWETILSNEL